jgi:hypothetical protein
MKRGGEEIYVGPLGRHSSQLIKYFEVGCNLYLILLLEKINKLKWITIIPLGSSSNIFCCLEHWRG